MADVVVGDIELADAVTRVAQERRARVKVVGDGIRLVASPSEPQVLGDSRRRVLAVCIALCAVVLTACGSKGPEMTPEQSRDSLVKIAHDTAALLDIDGWKDEVSLAQSCSAGVKFGYTYAAPPAESDRLAEAQKVAEYWRSLGIETRVDPENDPVVFGSGGPIQTISFSTGPGMYDVSGTSLCVTGDPDDYR